MNALALTDHGNLFGAIEFYRECKAAGLNPIIGYEAYVAPGKRTEREARRRGDAGFHLTLLAHDRTGFQNLVKMASVAFLEGYHYVPRIDKELLEAHKEGLICLSGCASGEFSEFILKDQLDEAEQAGRVVPRRLRQEFLRRDPEQRPGHPEAVRRRGHRHRQPARPAAGGHLRRPLPVARTTPPPTTCCCASTPASTRNDENRIALRQRSVLRPAAGGDVPPLPRPRGRGASAARRSPTAATSTSTSRRATSPSSRRRKARRRRSTCASCATQGLRERYGDNPSKAVLDRLEHELGIICRMGFASYFLIVWRLRALRRGERHPGQRPRLGVRRPGQLRPQAQPRRSAGVRPAVRALPRPQPHRGARHRHRLLPGPPRGSDRLRPPEVRRGQRGPDRHVRHHGRPRRHQGRGPGPRRAAGARQPADQDDPARRWASRSTRRWSRAPTSSRRTRPTRKCAS